MSEGQTPPNPNQGNELRAGRRAQKDLRDLRNQAKRYMVAVYGDKVWYKAPELFPNILERWIYAVASGADEFAEKQMAQIEAMAAETRRADEAAADDSDIDDEFVYGDSVFEEPEETDPNTEAE